MADDAQVEVEISDAELFSGAMADDPAQEPADAQATDELPEADADGPLRDASGRFAPKAGDQPAPAVTPPTGQQPTDADGGQIPAWRLREEAENRRAAEARAQQFERELTELRRNPPKPAAQVEPKQHPDPLMDPDGYRRSVLEEAREERRLERSNESFSAARDANTELFDKAYAEAQRNMDGALHARLSQSRDPGKELLNWYRQRETVREVGDDPSAWFERKFEEALKDPAKAAKAISILRAQQQQPAVVNGNRQPSPVRLPPSLSNVTPSGAAVGAADDEDISDEALFKHATSGMRR